MFYFLKLLEILLKNGDDNVIVHFKKTQRLNDLTFQRFGFDRT